MERLDVRLQSYQTGGWVGVNYELQTGNEINISLIQKDINFGVTCSQILCFTHNIYLPLNPLKAAHWLHWCFVEISQQISSIKQVQMYNTRLAASPIGKWETSTPEHYISTLCIRGYDYTAAFSVQQIWNKSLQAIEIAIWAFKTVRYSKPRTVTNI